VLSGKTEDLRQDISPRANRKLVILQRLERHEMKAEYGRATLGEEGREENGKVRARKGCTGSALIK